MKKFIKYLFILLFVFMFIPCVSAKSIPKEGVTYFLQYPNGEEDVVETYSQAIAIKEKLLYEGYTDGNGQIVLAGWNHEGEIRVVQDLPEGFTANAKEYKMDLSNRASLAFMNSKGILNSSNSRSIIALLILVVVISSSVIISRKSNSKKSLMVIPVVLALAVTYNAHAWTDTFVVSVNDDNGNPMKNVKVLIYGKPIIDAEPAVKFVSNGGFFFDGSTEMYFRIPFEGCSYGEFNRSLSEEDYYYIYDNIEFAYNDGYARVYPNTEVNLYNGTVLALDWVANDNENVISYDGNGGVVNFYDKTLKKISFYDDLDLYRMVNDFTNEGKYFIGTDSNPACTHYTEFGALKKDYDKAKKNYLCWSEKPDGVYVNDTLLIGRVESCFRQANMSASGNHIYLTNGEYKLDVMLNHGDNSASIKLYSDSNDLGYDINSIRIQHDGNDVAVMDSSSLKDNNGYYKITNVNKANSVYQYFDDMNYNGCIK